MSARTTLFILLTILVVLLLILPHHGAYAFGAGNIPSYAFLEGKAFRHGDIEDTLSTLLKKIGGGFLNRGIKFGGLDTKRVYFGNWLRDYSQAMDIAALKKLEKQMIINLCMVLGFLAHGYATSEFEVTEERLGVYLPTEHIDNPKGYGGDEDPRKYHPALRPPVDPRELEVDTATGMKNYIANEHGTWDTSKGLVRRTLEKCIHLGRQARASENREAEYEAYRLLGQALHTLEDFSAHSNFCELALVSLGHREVFTHVGDQVRIRVPNGQAVAPLITGTFGGADFIHSLLGEATDHISEASVSDLTKQMDHAKSQANPGLMENLRQMLFEIPGARNSQMAREMDNVQQIRAQGGMNGKTPDQMSPQELHAVLWQILKFRDSVMMMIEETIEKVPGLGPLIQRLTSTVSVFVLTTIEPFMKPILKQATSGLQLGSAEVVKSVDQFEVFDNPMASDPTHSYLSKDHFSLILNEPAGLLGKIVLTYTVNLVVQAWNDPAMPPQYVTEPVLECIFHPNFHDPRSHIQGQMLNFMREWIQAQPNPQEVLRRLSKQAVRNHENTRIHTGEHETGIGYNAAVEAQHRLGQYLHGVPGVSEAENLFHRVEGAYSSFQRLTGSRDMSAGADAGSTPTHIPHTSFPSTAFLASSPGIPYQAQPPSPGSYTPPSGPPPGQLSPQPYTQGPNQYIPLPGPPPVPRNHPHYGYPSPASQGPPPVPGNHPQYGYMPPPESQGPPFGAPPYGPPPGQYQARYPEQGYPPPGSGW